VTLLPCHCHVVPFTELEKARKELAETIRSEFVADHPLVLNWAGKILPEIFGAGNVDRLPVQ